MSRLWTAFLLFLTLAIALSAACVAQRAEGPITDDLNRSIEIKLAPQRIVSLAPSNTEILFALGLGDKVVGVDNYSDYPEEAKEIAKVGAYFPGFDPEAIVTLEPDLVIAFGYDVPEVVPKLEAVGIPAIVLAPSDIDDILADIELVGRVTDTWKRAKELTADTRRRIDAIVARTEKAPKPRVLWEFDSTEPAKPWVAGPGSFNDILIGLAGGVNIAAAGPDEAFQMNSEGIIAADPEIILLGDYQFGTTVDDVLRRPGWGSITAVRNGAIYPILDPNLTDRPGPRIVQGLEEIARIIHPELFP